MDLHATETVEPLNGGGRPSLLTPGSVVAGRYRIEGVLGSGGYSVVYRALDLRLRIKVALKLLRSDRDDLRNVRRFEKEVRITREVESPYLVRIFEFGGSAEGTYIAMELHESGTLEGRIAKGVLDVAETIEVARSLLGGLAALHANGITHGDVKPSNILFDGAGVARLSDFGLARKIDQTTTTEHQGLAGTFRYLAPEQLLGESASCGSDLYALGLVLFECLTGATPFDQDSFAASAIARFRQQGPRLRKHRKDVPRWFAAFVERLLHPKAAARFKDASEAMAAFETRKLHRTAIVRQIGSGIALITTTAAMVYFFAVRESSRITIIPASNQITARSQNGALLWRRTDIQEGCAAELRLRQGRMLATIPNCRNASHKSQHELVALETGTTVETTSLPRLGQLFPSVTNDFIVHSMKPVDADGDGWDELVVTYVHRIYAPSYALLVEPDRGRARLVLIASGHHWPVGVVKRDSSRLLLFQGINNRLSYSQAIAAVDPAKGVAATPDSFHSISNPEALAWYSLLPPGVTDPSVKVTEESIIEVGEGNAVHRIANDGLPIDGTSSQEDRRRKIQSRRDAYVLLRRAERNVSSGFLEEGLKDFQLAAVEAEKGGEPFLRNFFGSQVVTTLIALGRYDEADSQQRTLFSVALHRGECAFAAASKFHSAAALRHAEVWYRAALQQFVGLERGRAVYGVYEGLVLTLIEAGNPMEAERLALQYKAAYPSDSIFPPALIHFVAWYTQRETQEPLPATEERSPDLYRYWSLETALRRDASRAPGILATSAELLGSPVVAPLARSLRGEIHYMLGDYAEALKEQTAAVEELGKRKDDAVARVHRTIAERRLEKIRALRRE